MKRALPFLFIFFTNLGICQDTIQDIHLKWGLVYGFKTSYFNLNYLNDNLSTLSLPKIDNDLEYFSIGVSIRDCSQSSYMQIRGGYFNKTYNSNSTENVFFKSLYIEASINFNLLNSYKTIIYPKFSLGYMKNFFGIYDSNNNSLDFIDHLQNPNIAMFRSKGILYSDLGFGLEKRIIIFHSDFFLGINGSYQICFNKLKWTDINENYIQYFPRIRVNGIIIEVTGRIELDWERLMMISRSKSKTIK